VNGHRVLDANFTCFSTRSLGSSESHGIDIAHAGRKGVHVHSLDQSLSPWRHCQLSRLCTSDVFSIAFVHLSGTVLLTGERNGRM
jgi:hypothetical protein